MKKSQLEYGAEDISDWKELIEFYANTFSRKANQISGARGHAKKRAKWIFRGQRMDWELETSLDRAFTKYGIPKAGTDRESIEGQRRAVEQKLLRSFMRRAYHHLAHEPCSQDLLEWLAIMRHYGAPTRMLDWTYSFYVGVYNAVETWIPGNAAKREDKWPVVWALDAASLEKLEKEHKLSRQKGRSPKDIDWARHQQNSVVKYLMEARRPSPLVYSATAFRMNARLTAQQGTFLVQGTLAESFSANLKKSLGKNPKRHLYRICLKIDGYRRDEILCELNNMGINHATLYPDLEGFAKSLERHLAYPENWGLTINKDYGA